MMNFISKLQRMPVAARRRIAFFTTVVLGLVVIGVWSATFYNSMLAMNGANKSAASSTSPFEDIKSNFANVGSAFSDSKDSIQDAFNFNQ